MLETLSRSSSEAVKKAMEHLGDKLPSHQIMWLQADGASMLGVDKQDRSIQYVIIFGVPKMTFLFEVTTGRLIEGYKSFSLEFRGGEPGVPLVTINYTE